MRRKKGQEKYLVTRDVYKTIKKYDHSQMEDFLTKVYKNGYEDGRESVQGLDVKDVLEVLSSVKGIGPATMKRITDSVNQQFGGVACEEKSADSGAD